MELKIHLITIAAVEMLSLTRRADRAFRCSDFWPLYHFDSSFSHAGLDGVIDALEAPLVC